MIRLLLNTELEKMSKELIVSEILYQPCVFLRILCKITKMVGVGCLGLRFEPETSVTCKSSPKKMPQMSRGGVDV